MLAFSEGDEWLVPRVFTLEVAHTLYRASGQGRTSRRDIEQALDLYEELPIVAMGDRIASIRSLWEDAVALGIRAYDATYLRLDLDEGVPLATLDVALADSARRLGVPILNA